MWVVEVNVTGRRFTHQVIGHQVLGTERLLAAARDAAHQLNRLIQRRSTA